MSHHMTDDGTRAILEQLHQAVSAIGDARQRSGSRAIEPLDDALRLVKSAMADIMTASKPAAPRKPSREDRLMARGMAW